MQEIEHTANPFPGLRPFESTETHLFFGRDGQSEELLRRLKRTRFLAVVGTSGSGKSSLVRAGLLPALQGGLMASAGSDWRIAILRPGSDPIGNLAGALTSPAVLGSGDVKSADMQAVMAETTLRRSSLGLVELVSRARTKFDEKGQPLFPEYENLLVVIDQFEELFRFKQLIEAENSQEDAAAFVKLLLEAVGPKVEKIYVVLTMRSDFLGDCSQFWELPEAINNGQYLIPRMTRDERREAISGPVAVGQGAISEPLVNQLLNDVGDNPDQLPILQHALMRTWDHWLAHRNGKPMDLPDYEAIGGMGAALSRHADEAYAELNDNQQVIAEKLFKGLTEKGTDNREIRRPMEVGEICELTGANEAAVIGVIEVFRREGRSFLMPPPADAITGGHVHLNRESLIDISHESLIRNWERLKTWVDEESRSARIYRRLAETAVLHKEGKAGLWRDPDLGVALTWRDSTNPNHVWAKRYHPEFPLAMNFLNESITVRDALIAGENARRSREIRRTRLTALIFAVAFIFSLAMGVYAYGQKNKAQGLLVEAEKQKKIAETATEKTKEALEEATLQNQLARKANEQLKNSQDEVYKRAKEAEEQRNLAQAKTVLAQQNAKEAAAEKVRAETAARKATENEQLATENEQKARRSATNALYQINENRKRLYASSIGLAEKAYEAGDAERAQKLLDREQMLRKGDITSTHYRAEGLIALKDELGYITDSAWDEIGGDLRGFEWYYLWRLASRKLATFGEGPAILEGMNPAPALTAGPVAVYTARPVAPIAFGNEVENHFITVGDDNVVKMGLGLSSPPIVKLPAQPESVKAVAIVGLYHFVTGDRTAIKVWALPDPSGPTAESAPPTLVRTAKLKGNDSHIALAVVPHENVLAIGNGSTFMLWNLSKEQPITLSDGGDGYPSVCFVEKGEALITSDGRKLTRWNVQTNKASEIELLDKNNQLAIGEKRPFIRSLAFTPDGRKMVTSSNSSFMVWTAANADATVYSFKMKLPVHKESWLERNPYKDLVVAISPDGKRLATGDGTDLLNGGGVKLWDITGDQPRELFTLSPDVAYAISLAFSSDSRTLAVGSSHRLQLWDVAEKELSRSPFSYELAKLPVAIRQGASRQSARSPDGQVEALSGSPSKVEWWNPKSDPSSKPNISMVGTVRTRAMTFSKDLKLLAVGGGGDEAKHGMVTLWDTLTRKKIDANFEGHRGVDISVASLAFSHDSKILATGGTDKTVELWDISTPPEKLLTEPLEGHASSVTALAFSPDGRTIASGDDKGTVNLWSAASYQLLMTLRVSKSGVNALAFSDDGETLYSRDNEGDIRFWYSAPRQQVVNLERSASVAPLFGWPSLLHAGTTETRPSFHWGPFGVPEIPDRMFR